MRGWSVDDCGGGGDGGGGEKHEGGGGGGAAQSGFAYGKRGTRRPEYPDTKYIRTYTFTHKNTN
jgi:hypothetical protein